MELKFNVGDRVVHPQIGVGLVDGMEERQFEPEVTRVYYVIQIKETTLWVPVDFINTGLRKLSVKNEIDKCRDTLESAPLKIESGRGMLAGLSGRIKQGGITAQCEVIRDITAFGWKKPLFGPVSEFREQLLNVLCQEWATVDDVSLSEASVEIKTLLKKCKTTYKR
ncbi:MAG: hypothetical protein JXA13_12495 [Anaerolineales bacterium]|nr:hypothetical protein [Anaerolineales bacterium]